MRAKFFILSAAAVVAAALLVSVYLTPAASAAQVYPSGTPGATGTATAYPTHRPYHSTATATATPRPYTARPTNVPTPVVYVNPAVPSILGVWLGQLSGTANVRSGPGYTYGVQRVWYYGRRVLVYNTVPGATPGTSWYQVGRYPEPNLWISSSLVDYVAPLQTPSSFRAGRWIDVNLTQQTVFAYENALPVMLGQISSGKKGHETVVGEHHIYWRLLLQDMAGGGALDGSKYYRLKDVPWIQYFESSGDSLHGAYWHDNFGTPMSHGCVNLSDQNANWLYDWASYGTTVLVHY
ncbi:MAG: L,D-transpeptidase family protein [Chloroflexia bacterium]